MFRPVPFGRRGGFVVLGVAMLPVRHDGVMDIDLRDMYIADLRVALQRAVAEISFTAGQLAADDPEHAERLLAAADDLTAALERTAPPTA